MRRSTAWILSVVLLALFALLFVTPLLTVIAGGFRAADPNDPLKTVFTVDYLLAVFRDPIYVEGLLNSFKIALGTTTLATLISVPLAWAANRYDFAGKKLFQAVLLVPMILPPFVGAIGFQTMFGQLGAINTFFHLGPVDWIGQAKYLGVIVLQALSLYPVMYLNAAAALANVDPAMEQAAENLGCRGFAKFRRITLPLIMPGLFAGGTIVFIWSFTELGTPLIMNYTRCTPVQVFDALKDIGTSPFPYALVFVMLTASSALYAIGKFAFGRKAYAMQSKAATASNTRAATGIGRFLVPLAFAAVCLVALLPHVGVVLTSFAQPGSWYQTVLPERFTGGNYAEALGNVQTVNSIVNSLKFSSLAVLLNMVIGIAVAFVVVRSTVPLRGLLDAMAMLPLAVPGIVMAFGYFAISQWISGLAYVKSSPTLTEMFDVRTNPTLFLVIAYAVRRLPYMVRSAVAGLQQTSETLEEASRNLGASGLYTLRRVTLPLIIANLIAGAMLAFAFSMLEVSDSLILAQRADFFPITKTIYDLFQFIGTGKYIASALGVWSMAFLATTIVGASLIMGKKMGAIFRA
jgi:iron(III) transport system permease protein